MIDRITQNFRLLEEKEDVDIVIDRISKDVVFRGTNLGKAFLLKLLMDGETFIIKWVY